MDRRDHRRRLVHGPELPQDPVLQLLLRAWRPHPATSARSWGQLLSSCLLGSKRAGLSAHGRRRPRHPYCPMPTSGSSPVRPTGRPPDRPDRARKRASSTKADLHPTKFARTRPARARIRPDLARSRSNLAEFEEVWPEINCPGNDNLAWHRQKSPPKLAEMRQAFGVRGH